ncbi:hypothetical protein BGZ92_006257 [Podila epicladia]|nr:hypothetical protein BGZ92_006257 [Podila epicladia]
MPQPTLPVDQPAINQLIADELSYDLPSEDELAAMEQSLNCKQAVAYTAVMHAYNSNATAAFFIDGPAGSAHINTLLWQLLDLESLLFFYQVDGLCTLDSKFPSRCMRTRHAIFVLDQILLN